MDDRYVGSGRFAERPDAGIMENKKSASVARAG